MCGSHHIRPAPATGQHVAPWGSRSAIALCMCGDFQVHRSRDQLTKAATTVTQLTARCCNSFLMCNRGCHTSRFVMLAEERSWPKRNDEPNGPIRCAVSLGCLPVWVPDLGLGLDAAVGEFSLGYYVELVDAHHKYYFVNIDYYDYYLRLMSSPLNMIRYGTIN